MKPLRSALLGLGAIVFGAVPLVGCVRALSSADFDRQRASMASAAWIYRSDAAPAADQLLAKGIYCGARRTLEDNAVDAGSDAGITCEPEGGR